MEIGQTTKKITQEEFNSLTKEKFPVWSDADGETFELRIGPDYGKFGKKAPSGPALYDCVAVDVIQSSTTKRISHIATQLNLPALRAEDDAEGIKKTGLPRVVIINVQIPHKLCSVMAGKGYYDGDAGCSVVLVYVIKPETVRAALGTAEATLESIKAQINLLRLYNQTASTDPEIRRRFKAILLCDNIDDFNSLAFKAVRGYNGKPIIVNKIGDLFQDEAKTEYMEVDVKLTLAKTASLKGLDLFRPRTVEALLRVGFTIQGETDEELPENIFACTRLKNLSINKEDLKTVDF